MIGDERQRLLVLLRGLGSVAAQNGLMRLGDRDLAIALTYMDRSERDRVLRLLSPAKAARVADELDYQSRLRITAQQYRTLVETVIAQLRSGAAGATRSYVRPVNAPNALPSTRAPGLRRRRR